MQRQQKAIQNLSSWKPSRNRINHSRIKKCEQANNAPLTDFCGLLELVENMKFGYNINTYVHKGCKDFISQITKVKRSEVICNPEKLNMCV